MKISSAKTCENTAIVAEITGSENLVPDHLFNQKAKLLNTQQIWSSNPKSFLETVEWNGFYDTLSSRSRTTGAKLDEITNHIPLLKRFYTCGIECIELVEFFVKLNNEGHLSHEARYHIQNYLNNYESFSDGKKKYKYSIRMFCRWCSFMNLPSILVTELRCMRFLEMISKRPVLRATGNLDKRERKIVPGKEVGIEVLRNSMRALVHLSKIQRFGFPDLPKPRGDSISIMLGGLDSSNKLKMKDPKYDPQKGLSVDLYRKDLHLEMAIAFLNQSKQTKPIRGWANYNSLYATSSRSDWTRKVEWRHAFVGHISDQGPSTMIALGFAKTHFKNWTCDRPVIVGATRNKDVRKCCVSGISFKLFEEIEGLYTNSINFSNYTDWSNRKFFYGMNPKKEMAASTQISQFRKALKTVGVTTTHVTHIAKQHSLMIQEIKGVPENQTLRLAVFSSDVANMNCKRILLPLDAVRGLAGFEHRGDYFLPRQEIKVPKELTRRVFPFAEKMIEDSKLNPDADGICSTQGFGNFLIEARNIIFQDSLELRKEFPNLEIWKHEVFNTSEYWNWCKEALPILEKNKREHVPKSTMTERTFDMVQCIKQSLDNSSKSVSNVLSVEDREREVYDDGGNTLDFEEKCKVSSVELRSFKELRSVESVYSEWNNVVLVRDELQGSKSWRKKFTTQICRMNRIVKAVDHEIRLGKDQEEAIKIVTDLSGGKSLYYLSDNVLKKPKKQYEKERGIKRKCANEHETFQFPTL